MDRGLPSVPLISAAADREREIQLRHFESLDTKAGLILGFSGVLIALTSDRVTVVALIARAIGVLAATVALAAFAPRGFPSIDIHVIRRRYLRTESKITELVLLDIRVAAITRGSWLLGRKVKRLRTATAVLVMALTLTAADTLLSWR